jgi:uncharacterized coiled-coil protein SlyX
VGYFQDKVIEKLNKILVNQEKMMAAMDDLTARVTELEAEEVQIVTDIQTIIANSTGPAEATLEAVANRVNAVTDALKAGDPIPPVTPAIGA